MIHVVLDNYVIHSSRQTRLWLGQFGAKFRLHFLPPYCPDDNRIERKVWREMHANVTVNHRCTRIEGLVAEVVYYLMSHNRRAKLGVRELGPAILDVLVRPSRQSANGPAPVGLRPCLTLSSAPASEKEPLG